MNVGELKEALKDIADDVKVQAVSMPEHMRYADEFTIEEVNTNVMLNHGAVVLGGKPTGRVTMPQSDRIGAKSIDDFVRPTRRIELEVPTRTSSALLFTREEIEGETDQRVFHISELLPVLNGEVRREEGKERLREFITTAQHALGEAE